MTKYLATILSLILLSCSNSLSQQNTEQLEWLELSLFHKKAFDKIFFEYDTNNVYPGISPSGKCVFILPDTIFRTILPGVLARIDYSYQNEHMPLTTRLIQNKKGTIYSSTYLLNGEIIKWIRFDHFTMKDKEINLSYHTTDYGGKFNPKTLQFHRVKCILKKTGSEWKVKKISIQRIGCCDDRNDFANGVVH
jgi:hypothetical protein